MIKIIFIDRTGHPTAIGIVDEDLAPLLIARDGDWTAIRVKHSAEHEMARAGGFRNHVAKIHGDPAIKTKHTVQGHTLDGAWTVNFHPKHLVADGK